MPVTGIFGTTIDVLSKSIDLRTKSQNLISSNIANAETPNYIPKSLDFEQELQEAVKNGSRGTPAITHPRHLPLRGGGTGLQSVTGQVVETPAKTPGNDGNAVELENEMGRMVENQIMYNASVQMLAKKFEGLRTAIKGGN
ncbi:flagellar basal body rod protein FlgB [Geobacter sp. FeAm09]|uniref:flagellar basal body rod protein FlgB n=1 Tax=Geobacter sp. FeAm09 TaxID=2597769 RepID=UPI0011EFF9E2|nr:flagellar basal body rod protein FlgB [Geobacter sp. FeAm09]QEM69891.1 flagellar basal body rod protein FlgB [Geobacter sp. FeAm09]